MSADARIATTLPSHPKTKKLIRRLGEASGWRLVCLFLWATANRSDGDLSGMTSEDIELAIDWTGEDGAFVACLREVGFLDGEEGSYSLHDWDEHNPWAASAGARSEKSRWAALCKRHGREEAARIMPDYAKSMFVFSTNLPAALPSSASGTPLADSGTAPSPSPSPSPSLKALNTLSLGSDLLGDESENEGGSEVTKLIQIPYDEIVAAYHAKLPMLPAVRKLSDPRRRKLRARWLEDTEHQSVGYWEDFFAYAAQSDFLTGRDGRWTSCDFEWLIEASNHLKVYEGKYENKGEARGAA